MFFISAAIYVFGAIFYIIFASGEIQSWAQDPTELGDEEEKVELNSNGEITWPTVRSPLKVTMNGHSSQLQHKDSD